MPARGTGNPMMETLHCPSCGAPLDYGPRGEAETMRCPFCESTVMLPRSERPYAPPQVVVRRVRTGDGTAVTAGVIVAIVSVIVTAVVAFYAFHSYYSASTLARRAAGPSSTKSNLTPTRTAADGYAQPEFAFAPEGIGPGNFQDARSIALDAEGRVYVGEYTGGRIQVFDPSGKFLAQWTADRKMPLRGMAADRRGNLYVVQGGAVRRYEGTSGKDLGTLGSGGYDDVATTGDGGLVAFAWQSRDDIVRMDSAGHVTKVIRAAVSGQTDRSELDARVACDGTGNVYALGTFNNAVFKFSPEGKFLTQFGGDGDQAGQFRAPSAIAVDNRGRVYVADFKGVQVFDGAGRYLGLIKVKGAASGLVFDDKGALFVVARTQVYKFPPFQA
jgi:DNA-binding beta-propeller fold protein YncE